MFGIKSNIGRLLGIIDGLVQVGPASGQHIVDSHAHQTHESQAQRKPNNPSRAQPMPAALGRALLGRGGLDCGGQGQPLGLGCGWARGKGGRVEECVCISFVK
ncbi:phytochrome interacting factor 3-like 6 [Striga asiatica]|uniref:Phytochrome interacting factor 3-like 6 n=1 Tax=Striga asiatica TaxID=4170 RepID=A0A5A7PPY3_STRAF|nr:phytochrome interacting factor 3-like 6 [Striga asiatica]